MSTRKQMRAIQGERNGPKPRNRMRAERRCRLCGRATAARGLCSTHYSRLRRRGDPKLAAPREPVHLNAVYKFIEKYYGLMGYTPTYREIAQGCSLSSNVLARTAVGRLAQRKRVRLLTGLARGIVLNSHRRRANHPHKLHALSAPIHRPASKRCTACGRPVVARGLCRRHYARLSRSGELAQLRADEVKADKERVFTFLQAYWAHQGHAPTLLEVAKACGWRSDKAVKRYLTMLAKERRVHYVPGRMRAIALW